MVHPTLAGAHLVVVGFHPFSATHAVLFLNFVFSFLPTAAAALLGIPPLALRVVHRVSPRLMPWRFIAHYPAARRRPSKKSSSRSCASHDGRKQHHHVYSTGIGAAELPSSGMLESSAVVVACAHFFDRAKSNVYRCVLIFCLPPGFAVNSTLRNHDMIGDAFPYAAGRRQCLWLTIEN